VKNIILPEPRNVDVPTSGPPIPENGPVATRLGDPQRTLTLSADAQAVVERAAAGFDMKIHPHMLRHSCGFKLANDGVDTRTIQSYLGHKSIQHTVRYTELAPTRFKSLFRD
jgi:site-specific recombinase XerD